MGNMIIVGPNGKRFKVNAPAGTSVQEIEETFARENGGARGTVVSNESESADLTELRRQYEAFTSTPDYRSQQMGLNNGGLANYVNNPANPPLVSSIDTTPKRVVPDNPDDIGYMRKGADLASGAFSGIYRGVGATVGLGTYVPGLNKIADPVAEFLYETADYVDEKLLSDFQLSKKRELQTDLQAALQDMPPYPEDAALPEKIKYVADYVINQGGAAGSFLKDNPGQVANFIAETVPYIITGGALGKTASTGLNLIDNAVSIGSKAKGLTSKAAETSGRYAGAFGEGLVAAGDVGANTAISQRAEGNYGYEAGRLYGLLAAPVTATVGALGGRVAGVADADTLAARAFGAGTKSTDLVNRSLAGRVTKGAATEGVEELVQGGSEQVFSNLANDEAAYEGVGSSAVLGLATGSALGAGVNTAAYVSDKRAGSGPKSSSTDVNEVLEAAKDNVGEQLQLDLNDPSTPEQIQAQQVAVQQRAAQEAEEAEAVENAKKPLRRELAKTYDIKKFTAERTAQRDADLINPQTEIGAAFQTHLDSSDAITPAEIKSEQKAFLNSYLESVGENKETVRAEYKAELDRRIEFEAAAKQIELDFNQATAQEKRQAEVDKPALSATKAIEQTERMFGKDWIASGKYDDLEAAVNAPKFNRKKYAEALDKAVNPPAPTPVNTSADGVTPPSTQAAAEVADAAATLTEPEGLSEDQAKIFKVIADRFTGDKQNDIDTVYAGGEFLATKIAELAGVGQDAKDKGKSNVSKTIERLMTKVVENQGTVKRNSPKAEKDAAVKALAESLSTRAKEQRQEQIKASRPVEANQSDTGEFADTADVADQNPSSADNLGDVTDDGDNANTSIFSEQGMGTIASVGQGTNTGVSPEDQAFSESRTTTDEEVAAVAAKENQKIDDAVESQSALLKGLWDSGKSPDTMSFVDLNAAEKREIWFVVRQYLEDSREKGNDPKATLARARAELVQLETTLAPVEESNTNETTIPDAEPRRPTEAEESVRRERAASSTGDGQSGGGNVAPSQEAVTNAQENKTVVETKPKQEETH